MPLILVIPNRSKCREEPAFPPAPRGRRLSRRSPFLYRDVFLRGLTSSKSNPIMRYFPARHLHPAGRVARSASPRPARNKAATKLKSGRAAATPSPADAVTPAPSTPACATDGSSPVPHLPGFLRGRFEYAVDAVPVFFVFQPANTAFGVGFDPLGLKWNFVAPRPNSPLSRTLRRHAVYRPKRSYRYEHSELHRPGRVRRPHPRPETQRKRRVALHAHFERRPGRRRIQE